MFGSHLSIAGSLANALREAESLGLDCVQVFTKNQQQWRVPPLSETAVAEWKGELARLGWNSDAAPAGRRSSSGRRPAATATEAVGRVVSHASYLINLASPDDALWRRSVDLMHEEIERCERLDILYLVHHPGSSTSSTLEDGLSRIAAAYRELLRRTAGYRTICCLENTAGGGSTIGRTFEELARLRAMIVEATGQAGRVAFCFDTCHAHAAGYGMESRAKAAAVIDEFDRWCELSNLRVVHLNDSKAPRGSRLDRHEHIGSGTIGLGGFAAVVNHPGLCHRPMIMETPKGTTDKGTPWDSLNLRRLRRLVSESHRRNSATRLTHTPRRCR